MTENETQGFALVGMSLAFGLANKLKAIGVLPKEELNDLLEGVLTNLEAFPAATDEGVQTARALVDLLAELVAKSDQ